MPRGMQWFGWIYVSSSGCNLTVYWQIQPKAEISAHWLMGFFFGVLHLVYGAYLYLTEKRKNAA